MQRWTVATTNPGKVNEFQRLAKAHRIEFVGLEQPLPHVDETGATFAENALLKARSAHKARGGWVLADDSGLCVDALNGAPGIYSARYAEPAADQDAANRHKLLATFNDLAPEISRRAHFVCALVLLDPQGQATQVEGRWQGLIGHSEKGTHGFGYDSIFVPGNDPDGLTAAQLKPEQKSAESHRAIAFDALIKSRRL